MMLARLPAGVFAHDVGPPAGGRFCAWCSPAYRRAFLRRVLARLPAGIFAHGVRSPSWWAFLRMVLSRLAGGHFCIYGIQKKVLIF